MEGFLRQVVFITDALGYRNTSGPGAQDYVLIGDSFAAGMMGYLASRGETSLNAIKRALAYGTIVASFTIEAFSLQRLREIDRHTIDQRLGEYEDIVRFAP